MDNILGNGNILANIGKNMLSEGGEEALSYLANYGIDKISGEPDAKFDLKEFGLNTLAGGLAGGALGTGSAAVGTIRKNIKADPYYAAYAKAVDDKMAEYIGKEEKDYSTEENIVLHNYEIESDAKNTGFSDNNLELTRKKGESHRKTGEGGRKIVDKPTYNKLTKKFVSNGGIVIRGEDAKRHLGENNAASYLSSLNSAFIRDDATISDVLEEMYHAEQDRKNMFGHVLTEEVVLKREIDAQRYLLSVAEKYKIPIEETEITKRNLEIYEIKLAEKLKGNSG